MAATKTINSGKTSVKRKAEVVKDGHAKKPKVQSSKQHVKAPKPAKVVETRASPTDDSSDDFNAGGAELEKDEEFDSESEEAGPKIQDGVHPDRVKATANGAGPNGTSSKEAHAKQKQLVQERKNSKPLADQLARTKKIWERLRRKSHVPLEERKQLVSELFEVITGRIKDFVLKHDSVRVVQTAIKYANLDQKRMIARELQGTYRQLAESRYAKFLIGKLLVQGDNEIRDIIIPEFFGHVRHLIKHPEASWILDDVYRGVASRQQRATILREWYGAEFALFKKEGDVTSDLKEILAEDPSKRAPIMRSLQEIINQLIQKKLTGFTLLHDAMLQYFLNAKQDTEEITDFIELLKGDEEGDLLKNLAFTSSGARVVSLALAYGTAKDRKHILKTYKDTLQLMAADSNGHIIILTAYEVIDDTVLTSKSVFPELLGKDADKQSENVVIAANDLYARTTMLYLFQGRSKSLFATNLASDLEILKDVDEIRTKTSKKDPEIRRQELAKALSPFLLNAIASAPNEITATGLGCQLVAEILFGAEGDKSAALAAIASTAAGDPSAPAVSTSEPEATDENAINMHNVAAPHVHIAQTPFGGKMLKTLIAGGRFDSATKKVIAVEPPLNFANVIYPIIKDHLVAWATGASSFVVLGLLDAENFAARDEALKILKAAKKTLKKAAEQETPEQKAKAAELAAKAESGVANGNAKGKRGKKNVAVKEVGNKGSKLILEQLS